jgi:hypothetical protein
MADRGQIKGGLLDGPLAFDNAVSLVAAKTKGIVSAVAGRADILVVPDLESGNMIAKQLEYLANALSAGIVLGARVPIVLTSRADTAETRIASCVIAALMAHAARAKQAASLKPHARLAGAGLLSPRSPQHFLAPLPSPPPRASRLYRAQRACCRRAAAAEKNSAAASSRKAVISRLFPRLGKPRRKNYI